MEAEETRGSSWFQNYLPEARKHRTKTFSRKAVSEASKHSLVLAHGRFRLKQPGALESEFLDLRVFERAHCLRASPKGYFTIGGVEAVVFSPRSQDV